MAKTRSTQRLQEYQIQACKPERDTRTKTTSESKTNGTREKLKRRHDKYSDKLAGQKAPKRKTRKRSCSGEEHHCHRNDKSATKTERNAYARNQAKRNRGNSDPVPARKENLPADPRAVEHQERQHQRPPVASRSQTRKWMQEKRHAAKVSGSAMLRRRELDRACDKELSRGEKNAIAVTRMKTHQQQVYRSATELYVFTAIAVTRMKTHQKHVL